MKEGLLVLQYWSGDKEKAMRLAKFIADLEPTMREDVDFMFMARADCEHDKATADYVSRKFNVRLMKPKTRAAGHPWACWVTFFSVFEWVFHMKSAGKCPPYKWALCFEPDCVPVNKNWISECRDEWNRLNKYVVGSESFHWAQHLNGNAMYSCDLSFLRWFVMGQTMSACPPREPYDIWLYPRFVQWGVGASRKIINRCGQPTMSQAEAKYLHEYGYALVHGVKDDSLFHWAETNLRK